MTKTTYKVGDKVKVVAASHGWGGVSKGDEGVIARINDNGSYEAKIPSFDEKITWTGAEECFELISPKPTKNQRITTLEQTVADLQSEVEALKAAQKIAIKTPTMTDKADVDIAKIVESLAKATKKHTSKSPNEQASANEKRKAIIDEAKAFVEELSDIIREAHKQETKFGRLNDVGYTFVLKPEFHINDKKRAVTVLMKGANVDGGKIYAKGIAKCNPSDVFNEHIGKAIALGRALGLDVSKFEKVAQPSEVVVGQVVKGREETGHSDFEASVTGMFPSANDWGHGTAFHHSGGLGWLGEKQVHIIDDTEAKY